MEKGYSIMQTAAYTKEIGDVEKNMVLENYIGERN